MRASRRLGARKRFSEHEMVSSLPTSDAYGVEDLDGEQRPHERTSARFSSPTTYACPLSLAKGEFNSALATVLDQSQIDEFSRHRKT